MESKFHQTISELKPGNGFTILGTIEKLYPERDVPEPNRIKIKSKYDCICFHCKKKISEGDWIKWTMGSDETLHIGCESQYESVHGQTRETNKVRNALFTDVTGKMILTLWKNDTSRFSVGDKIMVENGWAYYFQKELHISAGYYGNLSQIQQTRGRNYHQEQQQRERQEQQQRERQEQQQRERQASTIDDDEVIEAFTFFQLNHNATFEQIKSKHREFTLKFHPDKNKSVNAHEEMKKVNHEYDVIMEWYDNRD